MPTPTSVPVQPQRYYALDALRASMMLLGLVFHSGVNYMQTSFKVWPLKDPATSYGFDLLCSFIHLFRMPVFFVAAGFFAALLYQKRGAAAMLRNRLQRVLLPLLLFYGWIIPLFKMSFVFALKGGGRVGWDAAIEMLTSLSVFNNMHLAHLWFLYYLLLLYVATLVLIPLFNRLPGSISGVFKQLTHYVAHVKALPLFMLVTFLTLLPMAEAGLDTAVSWIPVPHVLVAYGVFFAYGWLLYQPEMKLGYFKTYWAVCLPAGLVGTALLLRGVPVLVADPAQAVLVGKGLAAVALWLLIYASLGLFLRYFDKPNPMVRYLSDASYWIYLIHLPVVVLLVGLLTGSMLPAWVKFTIVLTGTFGCCLATYYLFVRSTFIGALLNGSKYARSLPRVVTKPVQAVA